MAHETTSEITGIHKVPLYGALAVVVLSLIAVTASVLMDAKPVGQAQSAATHQRTIRFESGPAGAFTVFDVATEEKLGSYGMGEGAFLRTAIRTMTLNRTSRRVAPTLPYQLVKAGNGVLTLQDPHTGHAIKLSAFGSVAHESFAPLLTGDNEEDAR